MSFIEGMGKRNPHQDCNPVKIQSAEDALKNASLNELKTGGIVFATYVISSQLSRTGVANALVPTAEAIAKALGDDVCEAIVLKAGVQTAGMSSTKAAAKIIAKELMVDGVMLVVLTGADVVELFRGRISEEELLKNLTVTIISIGVGTAGFLLFFVRCPYRLKDTTFRRTPLKKEHFPQKEVVRMRDV